MIKIKLKNYTLYRGMFKKMNKMSKILNSEMSRILRLKITFFYHGMFYCQKKQFKNMLCVYNIFKINKRRDERARRQNSAWGQTCYWTTDKARAREELSRYSESHLGSASPNFLSATACVREQHL